MSKTIRVTNEVFDRLEVLQRPRESKSDVVARLLEVGEAWRRASDNIREVREGEPSPSKEGKYAFMP